MESNSINFHVPVLNGFTGRPLRTALEADSELCRWGRGTDPRLDLYLTCGKIILP